MTQAEIQKNRDVKKEITKFKKIFNELPPDKKMFAEKLYTEAAFMFVNLRELKEKVQKEGAIVKSVNGNGFAVTAENPAQKSYNAMIKNYNTTIKNLIDLLPNGESANDEFIKYIHGDV